MRQQALAALLVTAQCVREARTSHDITAHAYAADGAARMAFSCKLIDWGERETFFTLITNASNQRRRELAKQEQPGQ